MSETDHPLHGLSCGDRLQVTTGLGNTYAGEIVDVPHAAGSVQVEDGVLITDVDTPTTVCGTATLSFECDSDDVDDVGELLKIKQKFSEGDDQHLPVLIGDDSVGVFTFRTKMGEITDIEVYDD